MSATDEIRITQEMRDDLTARCAEWVAIAASTGATDRAIVTASVIALYQLFELDQPTIIFCASPWQIAAAKAVLSMGATRKTVQAYIDRDPAPTIRPAPFVSQANDARLLWQQLWDNLDSQVPPAKRAELRSAKMDEDKYFKDQVGSMWKPPIMRWPLATRKADERQTRSFAWTSLAHKVSEMQKRLSLELEGACSARAESYRSISPLKELYEPSLTAHLEQRQDSRTMQILLEATAQNGQLIVPEMLGTFEQLRTERIVQLGWSVVQGRLMDEYDRLWPVEKRERFNLWLAAAQVPHELWNGAWTIGWLPFYQFVHWNFSVLPFGPTNLKRLRILLDLARSAACCLFYRDVCIIGERPLVFKTDERGRLHCEDGPALAYGDGFKLYSWHGVTLPDWIIKRPQDITVDKISFQFNAEIRRVMIERYGTARYIQDSLCEIVDTDECGVLYSRPLPGDEPLVMVKVRNSTPEPDGTYKEYFLRVPPTMRTAREAVAWTFAMNSAEYKPQQES